MALFRKKNSALAYGLLLLLLTLLHQWGRTPSAADKEPAPECRNGLYVQVLGAVPHPGVYLLCGGEDLATLLHKSGYEGAALSDFKQPPPLMSGGRVFVEKNQKERYVTVSEMPAFQKVTLSIPLSLNRETEEGLCAVPGIGPGLARKITAERTKRGGFRDLSDLQAVQGIGPKKFERFKLFLTL